MGGEMLIIIIRISFLFTFCITQLMRTWRYKATLCKILVSLRLIGHFSFVRVSLECYSTYLVVLYLLYLNFLCTILTDSHYFLNWLSKLLFEMYFCATNSHDYQVANNNLVVLVVLISWLINVLYCG